MNNVSYFIIQGSKEFAHWSIDNAVLLATVVTPLILIATLLVDYFAHKKTILLKASKMNNHGIKWTQGHISNIGTRTVNIKDYGCMDFDGQLHQTASTLPSHPIGPEDSIQVLFSGKHMDVESIYYLYAKDISGKMYRAYPNGFVFSYFKNYLRKGKHSSFM